MSSPPRKVQRVSESAEDVSWNERPEDSEVLAKENSRSQQWRSSSTHLKTRASWGGSSTMIVSPSTCDSQDTVSQLAASGSRTRDTV